MGRKRLSINEDLPERVYLHHGKYVYRPKGAPQIPLGSTWLEMSSEHSRLVKGGAIAPMEARGPGVTLGALVDDYTTKDLPKLAPDTVRRYEPFLRQIKAALGDLRPEQLRPRDLYEFIDGITEAPGSRNIIITIFRKLFKKAVRKGLCDVNPARELEKDPTPGRGRAPTFVELVAFKEKGGEWWACYIDFKLLYALRQKDMLELPPIALDAEEFEVEISKSKRWRASEQRRVGEVAGYTLTDEARAILRRLYALKRPQSRERLFCGSFGQPLTEDAFYTAWRKVLLQVVPGGRTDPRWFHEHDIRGTVATSDPDGAQNRLRHKKRTTTDTYLRKFERDTVAPLPQETVRNRAKAGESLKIIRQASSGKPR